MPSSSQSRPPPDGGEWVFSDQRDVSTKLEMARMKRIVLTLALGMMVSLGVVSPLFAAPALAGQGVDCLPYDYDCVPSDICPTVYLGICVG
jgi:hypothetical protein